MFHGGKPNHVLIPLQARVQQIAKKKVHSGQNKKNLNSEENVPSIIFIIIGYKRFSTLFTLVI